MRQWRMSALPYFTEFVLAVIITMRLLNLEILCGDESLISVFHFLCKAIVPVYYSVYLPFLLSKMILSCSLRFIKFLILCTLRLIYLFLRLLFYSAVLYLLSVLLTSNLSCIVSAFYVNVTCLVNNDFNDLMSFLIFSNNAVINVDAHVKVDNYLDRKFYDHNFKPKPESNSNNLNRRSCF